jgi:alanine racemase
MSTSVKTGKRGYNWAMKKLVKSILRKIRTSQQTDLPLISISISKDAILGNVADFKKKVPGTKIAPVLKSNAYGHGLALIATILEKDASTASAIPFFVIDSYFEARALRNEGVKIPLLVIGYTPPETILRDRLKNVICTATSLDTIKNLSEHAVKSSSNRPIKIHLKIDTGMRRQGISVNEIDEAVTLIKKSGTLVLEGICSHLPDADGTDSTFTREQIKLWNGIVEKFRKEFPSLAYWHLSNTDGHAFAKDIHANVSRLGIGLYLGQTPALEMKTIITGIKKVQAGDKIGYSGTFVAPHDMIIATIPVGYFEGIDRRLSNKGFVKIEKDGNVFFAPIIGRVSMNITTVDVSGLSGVCTGDTVIVFSAHQEDKNSINSVAEVCGTIPYEILVHIPVHLKRVGV